MPEGKHLDDARQREVRTVLDRLEHPPVDVEGQEASVLVPLFEADGREFLVLTKRSEEMPTHAGQIAFPGGSREIGDADLLATAVRETHEELGLDPSNIEPLGQIAHWPTFATTFVVSAFAASIEPPRSWDPSIREIADVYEVPMDDLRKARELEERERDGVRFMMPVFPVEGIHVWGFTAYVLARFLDVLDG